MTESELVALIQTEVRQSIGYYQGQLAEQRRRAMDYYYGEPYGNEQEGRSRIVTREVLETVEWILPSLMKIFTSGDEIVRFDPQGPQDDQAAQQATDYINYVFQRQSNGFMALYSFFKDALLQKNGFLKVYWQQTNHRKTERYQALNQMEVTYLLQNLDQLDVEYEIKSQETDDQGRTNLELVITRDMGHVRIEPVAPEEVLVNRRADFDLDDARFVACRTRTNLSALREMGFVVDNLRDYSEGEWTLERIARFRYEEDGVYQMHDETDPAMREIWLVEAYPKVDFDGDGVAERRIVHIVGNQLLKYQDGTPANFEIEHVPLVTCTPCPMPHKLFGLSLADLCMDLQIIKSTVLRQILDNMYLANNSRMMVLDGMANIDDLLSVRPGGIVRVKAFNAVQPLPLPLLGAPAFDLLGYLDEVREDRTGVSKQTTGGDADSLNRMAQGGINQIMTAAQQRLELIARIFAETGVKDLFWAILELTKKHATQAQQMRLSGKWVAVDPREWDTRFDMSVSVGLGTGSHSAQLAGLQLIGQIQQALNMAGMGGLVVTPQNAYNFALDAARAVNPRRAEMYFTNPNGQMPQPKPSPEEVSLTKAKMQNDTKRELGGMHVALEAAKLDSQEKGKDKEMAHDTNMEALKMITEAFTQAGVPQPQPPRPQ